MGTLRARREALNIGLREMARRLGIDPAHLSRIENGLAAPSPKSAATIADGYGVSELHVLYPERYGPDGAAA